MLKLSNPVGDAADPAIAGRLHDVAHRQGLEYITLSPADVSRRRLHAFTDRGTEVGIALDRDARLANGTVLLLEPTRAIVVRLDEPNWLTLAAASAPDALELGYFAGNMHWKVRFDGSRLMIALEGPVERYLVRLRHFVADGRVRVLG